MSCYIWNRSDQIRQSPSARHLPRYDFKIAAPRGESAENRKTRLRAVGVSRTGQGIARIVNTARSKKHRGEFYE